MAKKQPSLWTRTKWLLFGKPVSHEEAQAARHRPVSDPATLVQMNVRRMDGGFPR